MSIDEILGLGPVVPVVAIHACDDAVPLARALLAGGIRVIEVTLRTPVALECIRLIRSEVPDIVVGAGTVLTERQFNEVAESGARFAVSPGVTASLLDAARRTKLPFLPAASTVSESMRLSDEGFDRQKFFPASASGGTGFLCAVSSVLPNVSYCPTGGIGPGNAADYLRLPNVTAVGGSWVTPPEAITNKAWAAIEELARAASRVDQDAEPPRGRVSS